MIGQASHARLADTAMVQRTNSVLTVLIKHDWGYSRTQIWRIARKSSPSLPSTSRSAAK